MGQKTGTNSSGSALMKKAIALAWKGIATVSPNPPVGAVVVKNGKIIGRGWHQTHGGPHAEVYALQEAGAEAKGADIYVSLEPCNHHGRTPPCVEAILQAGIKKVFLSCSDPNPKVQGGGAQALRDAGVEVVSGVEIALGEELLLPWKRRTLTGKPFEAILLGGLLSGGFFALDDERIRTSLSSIARRRIGKIRHRFSTEGRIRMPKRDELESKMGFAGVERIYLILLPEFANSQSFFLDSSSADVFSNFSLLHQQRIGAEVLAVYSR